MNVIHRPTLLFAWAVSLLSSVASAQPAAQEPPAGMLVFPMGVTSSSTPMTAWINREDLDVQTARTRILLVGGLDNENSSTAIHAALQRLRDDARAGSWRERYIISAIPTVFPDRQPASPAKIPLSSFPPPNNAYYNSPTAPETAYLWRWIGMHAPDLVVDVRRGENIRWMIPAGKGAEWSALAETLSPGEKLFGSDELVVQLQQVAPCETGTMPALRVSTNDGTFLSALLNALDKSEVKGPSPARRELQIRLARIPYQVAEQMATHYGRSLNEVAYIPAMALIARLRLAELHGEWSHRTDVERIVAPYVDGTKPTKPDNGSALSGHLIFCELADRSTAERRKRYVELARSAADQAFAPDGRMLESMPYHLEMSDALFMGGPILAHVGALTNEARYFDACLNHLRFMRKLCLRSDGLYRHSPLDETAWGRGNGFPALGIALSLAKFPADHAGRAELQLWLANHLRAMLRFQDQTGCWHQVIDHPESYRELTATCMIAYAISRAIRERWLTGEEFQSAVDRAWYAIRMRAPSSGRLVDVCTGTGKQNSLRAYFDRPAILGPDDRGGAMALLIATELAQKGAQ